MPSCNLLKRHCGLTGKRLSFVTILCTFAIYLVLKKVVIKQTLEFYIQLKENSTLRVRSLSNYGKLKEGGPNNALIRGNYGGTKDVTTFKNHEELKEKENSTDDPQTKKPGKGDNRTVDVLAFENYGTPKYKSTQKAEPKTMPPLKNGFQLVFPYIEPKLSPQDKVLYLVVMVLSSGNGEDHRILRKTIRKTWGDTKLSDKKTKKWKMFFSMAVTGNQRENEMNEKEALDYNDVIIGNFTETYKHLVVKTFMGHYWVINRLSCRYILKADDDVYVRVPMLISWLVRSGSPKSFYGGCVTDDQYIHRDPRSQWYVPYNEYKETSYPPWCRGPFYVISSENIPKYLDYIHILNPFKTEDTYTAVISQKLGINPTSITGFQIIFDRRQYLPSELDRFMTLGHRLLALDMERYHDYYVRNNLTTV